jgi:alkylation response protein AidB-like acyl-CoA dehydrogenase
MKIADMATQIEYARWLTYAAAWLKDQGRDFSKEAAMAKRFSFTVATATAPSSPSSASIVISA